MSIVTTVTELQSPRQRLETPAFAGQNRGVSLYSRMEQLLQPYLPPTLVPFAPPFGTFVAITILFLLVLGLFRGEKLRSTRLLLRRIYPPIGLIAAVLVARVTARHLFSDGTSQTVSDRVFAVALVVLGGFLVQRTIGFSIRLLRRRFASESHRPHKSQQVTTQLVVLERVSGVVVAILTIAISFLVIPEIQRFGASLLASAGIAGLVLGVAAQRTIGSVMAGIQIAIAQPLRLDDEVMIDGEWGRVEELTLTYVVVRAWDQRRLVVPISHLLEHPFENWTRESAGLIGTVELYADYSVDLEKVRKEQARLLTATDLWDGETDAVQVVKTTEQAVVIRSQVGAADATALWALRCYLREGLVQYLQRAQPNALPRTRLGIQGTVRRTRDT